MVIKITDIYINERINIPKTAELEETKEKIKPEINDVMLIIWLTNKVRKKRLVNLGVIKAFNNRFITLAEPKYNMNGKKTGETAITVKFSEIYSNETAVIRLGSI